MKIRTCNLIILCALALTAAALAAPRGRPFRVQRLESRPALKDADSATPFAGWPAWDSDQSLYASHEPASAPPMIRIVINMSPTDGRRTLIFMGSSFSVG